MKVNPIIRLMQFIFVIIMVLYYSVTQIKTDLGFQIKKDFEEGTTTKGIKVDE